MIGSEDIGCFSIPLTEEGFQCERALAKYIGVNFIPDIFAKVQVIAPGNKPIDQPQLKSLRKVVGHMKETIHARLDFVKLDLGSV